MTNDGQWEFLDCVTMASFIITALNYGENIDQNVLSDELNNAVTTIRNHLKQQDEKLDKIMKKLEVEDDEGE